MSVVRALKIRNGQADGVLDMYRYGDAVIIVGAGDDVRDTPYGKIRTRGAIVREYETVEAYEYERDKWFNKFPLAYTKIVGRLGVDDDARRAPPLPEDLYYLLSNHARALGDGGAATATSTMSGRPRETPGRPFLALVAAKRGDSTR